MASSPDALPGREEEKPASAVALANSVAAVSTERTPDKEQGTSRVISPDRCVTSSPRPCAARPLTSAESGDDASARSCRAGETAHCQGPSSRLARRRQTQHAQRLAEREARRKATRFVEQLAAEGISCPCAAAILQVVPRTLRSWRQDFCAPLGEPEPRGRPGLEVNVATRNQVFQFLHHVTGPAIGLPALRALFQTVPRCILADLSWRYRQVWRRRYAQHGFELTWHFAGTVWAMDFTQPLQPIDGVFPYLLAIRDLASHCQLAWRPVRGETAEDVLPVLQELFAAHGPPLVLKNDNGSAFLASIVREMLSEAAVAQLFSPVRQPQYNGALERSNGVLKTYTHHHAVSAGHPFRWTSEDVGHAQHLANTISRPWGARGLSPDEAWQLRPPIPDEERLAFVAALSEQRQWAARELDLDLAAELSVADHARLDRLAISSVLQELGYLTLQRIGRAERPKRLTREKLARRVAEFRGELPASKSSDAEKPTPPQSPELAPGEPKNLAPLLLAGAPPSVTMLATSGPGVAPPTGPQAVPSARRERTITSWFRRTLAPLLPFWNSAKISR